MNPDLSKKYNVTEGENCVFIEGTDHFRPSRIFDCGQCFRFYRKPDGSYFGVAKGKYIEVDINKNGDVILKNCTLSDYEKLWRDYFSLDLDYKSVILSYPNDEITNQAAEFAYGLRILHQDEWEALCSFIISQNNNIPRIKGIIEAMSRRFGKKSTPTKTGMIIIPFPTRKPSMRPEKMRFST